MFGVRVVCESVNFSFLDLKRFSETRWSKLSNVVEFPTGEGELNMAPYAATPTSNTHYTLYAVSNHMGELSILVLLHTPNINNNDNKQSRDFPVVVELKLNNEVMSRRSLKFYAT